ncbi:MAG: hypothetical protein M0Z38_09850 [Deltaproteobacteria bacterium]|nr:hypothetical protein [Deltaproteobacteria bacterium]
MKKITGLATAAVLLLVSGGLAFSAERQELKFTNPAEYWEFEGPNVTGSIPQGEDLSKVKAGNTDGFAKAEYGGIVYRGGIDTN